MRRMHCCIHGMHSEPVVISMVTVCPLAVSGRIMTP